MSSENLEAQESIESVSEGEEAMEQERSSAETLSSQMTTSASPASIKSFRSQPEVENFYRFVHENDLRLEASELLEAVIEKRQIKH